MDRFVAAKLEAEDVAPSPEAERPYLIRRVFFDLTGLPPGLAELDRWENATDEDWYEQTGGMNCWRGQRTASGWRITGWTWARFRRFRGLPR